MTYAEWIRSMGDDELAKLLYKFCANGERCYDCPLWDADCGGDKNPEEWKMFLKKEITNE